MTTNQGTGPSATGPSPTRNEAAIRLAEIDHPCHEVCVGNLHADCQCAAWMRQEAAIILDAALSEERRLTVERIRERTGRLPEYKGDITPILEGMARLLRVLDEVAGGSQ